VTPFYFTIQAIDQPKPLINLAVLADAELAVVLLSPIDNGQSNAA